MGPHDPTRGAFAAALHEDMHTTPNIFRMYAIRYARSPDLIPDEAHVTIQYTTPAVNKGAVKASG